MSEISKGTVAVIGTGTIGSSWAALFLAHGYDVNAYDPAEGAGARLNAAVAAHWPVLSELGLASGASPDRLQMCDTLEKALDGVIFVQENGPEREAIKIPLFAKMDALLPPEVILASSSSGLRITPIQAACLHGSRVLIGHPFNPPHLIPLVEIVKGDHGSDDALATAKLFYEALGKTPIVLRKEVPGHIANRLQAALWAEALQLVASGVASAEDVDCAITHGPGLRWALMGPLMNLELAGGDGGMAHALDHLGPAMQSWWDDMKTPEITPELIAHMADATRPLREGHSIRQLDDMRAVALLNLLRLKADADLPGK